MVKIYCVNFEDALRRNRIMGRFSQLNLDVHFVDPVYKTDSRLDDPRIPQQHKRTYSIMLQHLDSLKDFIETTDETEKYCIVCEDDILISKRISEFLPEIVKQFDDLHLDILLLGYLFANTIDPFSNGHFPLLHKSDSFLYTEYPDDLWGSQMYLVSKSYAQHLLNVYTPEYIYKDPESIPYNPDWIITKVGRRGLIVPMLAVEEGGTKNDNYGQNEFHKQSFFKNYVEGVFV